MLYCCHTSVPGLLPTRRTEESMNAFSLAFNTVFPLILLIGLGYVLQRTGYLSA